MREILRLSEKVGYSAKAAGVVAKTIVLKIRFANFSTITRSKTLNHPTGSRREIYQTASQLFKALNLSRVKIRLVGVRIENLLAETEGASQLAFDQPAKGWPEIEEATERASQRFGSEAVKPARLIEE